MSAATSDLYDHPAWFDLLFRDETAAELAFFQAQAQRHGLPEHWSVLEPGCGGGRLLVAMAARGHAVHGFDRNPRMVAYTRRRLRRRGLAGHIFLADLADFRLADPVHLVVNTFNTFRHLLTEASARRHLALVADALRPGGLFILGLHLLPWDVDPEASERWTARHGQLRLTATLRAGGLDRRRRLEQLRICLLARRPSGTTRVRCAFPLRVYTPTQFRRLLAAEPRLELVSVHDFWYDAEESLPLDDSITDTVVVLRRR